MWVSGAGRADVIVRTSRPVDHLSVEAHSPIRTVLTVSAGAGTVTVPIEANKPVTFDVPAANVHGLGDYTRLLQTTSSQGFVPHAMDPASLDTRNLGAQLRFSVVLK
jgi:hypothetical protein